MREFHSRYSQFLTRCSCGAQTSKAYARAHDGQCKACADPGAVVSTSRGFKCPDCGENTLSAYQRAHKYHCDACTRAADPEGYRQELTSYSEGREY